MTQTHQPAMPGKRDPRIVIVGDGEITTVEVTEEATSRFADDVAEAMGPTVWNTGCNSWYFADDNHIDLWPFDRKHLTRMLTRPQDDDYILTR
jgi:hypothetical protein